MENPEIINTNEHCDSPVYVETSPVSSPVFVSKERETDSESSTQVKDKLTDKLILPQLNESLLLPIIETNSFSSSTVSTTTISPTSPTSPSLSAAPTTTHTHTHTHTTTTSAATTASTEMVTIVIKDLNYCYEEFSKQIKENNVSISPQTIMRLLRLAMIIVEQTNESGTKKKEFVISLLKMVVTNNNSMLTEHKLEALNLITGGIVSDSIDFLIDASKGKFDVNKVEKIAEEVAKSCFTICLEKFSKKK
jgi:hypothetical protein